MSDKTNALPINFFLQQDEAGRRVAATSAALEVILAKASSAAPLDLESEFENLSVYVDQILKAAKGS